MAVLRKLLGHCIAPKSPVRPSLCSCRSARAPSGPPLVPEKVPGEVSGRVFGRKALVHGVLLRSGA